jgi:hypothetical protein
MQDMRLYTGPYDMGVQTSEHRYVFLLIPSLACRYLLWSVLGYRGAGITHTVEDDLVPFELKATWR